MNSAANTNARRVSVSIVVPVYCGEQYLESLVKAVAVLRDRWAFDSAPLHVEELIFVDDDAVDGSVGVLDRLEREFFWVRAIHLSRNFGQHPATIAGILHTCGDWVITMDEDLQHLPDHIPEMLRLAALEEFDVIYANPDDDVHESSIRDIGSRVTKWLTAMFAGDMAVLRFNSFRAIRGSVARSASGVCGHETYFDVALSWFTRRTGVLRVEMKDRRFIDGKRSGYSLRKLASHARRLIMSSRIKALRIGAYIGIVAMMGGFSFAAYVMLLELVNPGGFGARGWGSLIVSNLVLGGMVLFLLSAVLEYLSILVLRAQGKPTFFVVDRSSDTVVAAYLKSSKS